MQLKYVRVVSVQISDPQAVLIGRAAGVVDEGGRTSTREWLSGTNAWGFHNDLRFTQSLGTIRQSMRIMEAVEKATQATPPLNFVELLAEDHALLLQVVQNPSRHQNTVPPPIQLLRGILPILQAVEEATEHLSKEDAAALAALK